jgi:hypothetical protein
MICGKIGDGSWELQKWIGLPPRDYIVNFGLTLSFVGFVKTRRIVHSRSVRPETRPKQHRGASVLVSPAPSGGEARLAAAESRGPIAS